MKWLTVYLLGVATPFAAIAVIWWVFQTETTSGPDKVRREGGPAEKQPNLTYAVRQIHLQQQQQQPDGPGIKDRALDMTSPIEAAAWVRFATLPVEEDAGEQAAADADADAAKAAGSNGAAPAGARSSLLKIMKKRSRKDLTVDVNSPPKSIYECARLWAVVRGGQIQFFENEQAATESAGARMPLVLPKYIVMLWPPTLRDVELFYRRHPIALISRTGDQGTISLDLHAGEPPKSAVYLYLETAAEKEKMYFALVKESTNLHNLTEQEIVDLSKQNLGPRDPNEAQPLAISGDQLHAMRERAEKTDVWWLNALLARLFYALHDTKMVDDYLRWWIAHKIEPVSHKIKMLDDLKVIAVSSGKVPPLISNVKVKSYELDGTMLLTANLDYTGCCRLHLGATVSLGFVSSSSKTRFPVELAANIEKLQGTILITMNPPPSARLWYAFEEMPHVELAIEPVVNEWQVNNSLVCGAIKKQLLSLIKEALVYPNMEDLCFFYTPSFYRGGIWETDRRPAEPSSGAGATSENSTDDEKTQGSGSSSKSWLSNIGQWMKRNPERAERRATARSEASFETEPGSRAASLFEANIGAGPNDGADANGGAESPPSPVASIKSAATASTTASQPLVRNRGRTSSAASKMSLSPRRLSSTTTKVSTETASPHLSPLASPGRRAPAPAPLPRSRSTGFDARVPERPAFERPSERPSERPAERHSERPLPERSAEPSIPEHPYTASIPEHPYAPSIPEHSAPDFLRELSEDRSQYAESMRSASTRPESIRSYSSRAAPNAEAGRYETHNSTNGNDSKSLPNAAFLDAPADIYSADASSSVISDGAPAETASVASLGAPSYSSYGLPAPTTTTETVKPALVQPLNSPRSRRSVSVSSLHSLVGDSASIGSGGSRKKRAQGPKLPPRRRLTVLQNVPPEQTD